MLLACYSIVSNVCAHNKILPVCISCCYNNITMHISPLQLTICDIINFM